MLYTRGTGEQQDTLAALALSRYSYLYVIYGSLGVPEGRHALNGK